METVIWLSVAVLIIVIHAVVFAFVSDMRIEEYLAQLVIVVLPIALLWPAVALLIALCSPAILLFYIIKMFRE